jgi:O-antigen ligase
MSGRSGIDRFERGLLCISVFLAPIQMFRPSEFSFTFSDFFFCLLGVMMIVRRKLNMAPLQDVTIIWVIANLMLIGGLYASSIINGSAAAALVVCTQYFFAYVFLSFIIMGDEERALLIAKTFVYAIMFIVVCGFGFVATGYDGGFAFITGSGRLTSFYSDANYLALQLALTLPLVMYLWFVRSFSSLTAIIMIICIFIGLILASSNSGIGAAVLGLGLFLLLAGSFQRLFQGMLLAGTLVVLASTVGYDHLPEVFQKRVLSALESGSIEQAGSFQGRLELIEEAVDKLDNSLFLGIGTDQYRERSSSQAPVHNTYLLIWVEGGTIAIFGFLLILASIGFVGIRSYQFGREGAQAGALVLSVLVIFIFVATTLPHLYQRFWIMPAFIAINLALVQKAAFAARMSAYTRSLREIVPPPPLMPTGLRQRR